MRRFLLVWLLLAPLTIFASQERPLKKRDFTTWPRANAKEFGCFLEQEFHHKDKKFNCALKDYRNQGDPCKSSQEYYEGPQFPAEHGKLFDKRVESLELAWEHGELQSLTVMLRGKIPERELRKKFRLPKSADIQACGEQKTCIVLQGFGHVGAGDIGCAP